MFPPLGGVPISLWRLVKFTNGFLSNNHVLSRVKKVIVWVKCFSQEYNIMIWPGPEPLDLLLSYHRISHSIEIKKYLFISSKIMAFEQLYNESMLQFDKTNFTVKWDGNKLFDWFSFSKSAWSIFQFLHALVFSFPILTQFSRVFKVILGQRIHSEWYHLDISING